MTIPRILAHCRMQVLQLGLLLSRNQYATLNEAVVGVFSLLSPLYSLLILLGGRASGLSLVRGDTLGNAPLQKQASLTLRLISSSAAKAK